jgi:hypothetical protein
MAAPRDIVDALECVGSICFSDVRHKTRAAFILADELVEMCCKALAFAANPNLGNIQFPTLVGHPAVRLPAQTVPLGDTLLRNHRTRNQMQHGNAAFTGHIAPEQPIDNWRTAWRHVTTIIQRPACGVL